MENRPIFKELLNATIVLALITSLLYISGSTYTNSYLTEWGVESSLIKNNTQELLVQGAALWFLGGIYFVGLALILSIIVIFPFYLVREISKSPISRKISLKIYEVLSSKQKDELEPPVIFQSITKWVTLFFISVISLMLFLYFFYKLIDFSSSQAISKAAQDYKSFSTNDFPTKKIFHMRKAFTIEGKIVEGFIIANSEVLIVLYIPPLKTNLERERGQADFTM